MRKKKSLDLREFNGLLKTFINFVAKKGKNGHRLSASRLAKRLSDNNILEWEYFINMPMSDFKKMFDKKFRAKLIKWLREFMTTSHKRGKQRTRGMIFVKRQLTFK